MPVRLSVGGREVQGSWGMDVMVAPERQRQGLGEVLFRTWDRNVGASLGLGLSDSSYRLFQKLRWPDVGPVPCLVKPLTRRALRRPNWPRPDQPAGLRPDAAARPHRRADASAARGSAGHPALRRQLHRSLGGAGAEVRPSRSAATRAYLNWKYVTAPHVRYSIAALRRENRNVGYAVYRHLVEPRGRVTLLADFLTDPDDETALPTLLQWVDREARGADSDKIRSFAMHGAFRRVLRRSGYFQVKSTMEFVAKINALDVPPAFYEEIDPGTSRSGDSDQDRDRHA